jgi:hypothetical protein
MIFLAVVLGALATVLVAWGCSMWVQLAGAKSLDAPSEALAPFVPGEWGIPPPEEGVIDFRADCPSWQSRGPGLWGEACTPFVDWVASGDVARVYITWGRVRLLRAGWPFLCLRSVAIDGNGSRLNVPRDPLTGQEAVRGFRRVPYGSLTIDRVWALEPPAWLAKRRARNILVAVYGTPPNELPCRPEVPGFLADWAVFSAAMLGSLWLMRSAHRWTRRRRGRCVACGYDRRGLAADAPCPECGAVPVGARVGGG